MDTLKLKEALLQTAKDNKCPVSDVMAELMKEVLICASDDPYHVSGVDLFAKCDVVMITAPEPDYNLH